MERGTVVEFPVKGQNRVAVIEGPEGKQQFKVTDTFGNSLIVHPRDLSFCSTDYPIKERKPVAAVLLQNWLASAEAARGDVDLQTVWELFEDRAGAAVPLADLASCFWDELTTDRAYALFCVLRDDKVFFKLKGKDWEVRTAAQVQEFRKQASAAENRAREQQAIQQRFEARLADRRSLLETEDLRRIEILKRFALFGEEAAEKNTALDLLNLLKRPKTDVSALACLIELGVWSRHENLDALRAGLVQDFEPNLEEQARALSKKTAVNEKRTDLSSHYVVTIDDESTTEIDDGLSVETLADGEKRFWIHIADPGSLVELGSDLSREARRRGTTVYLPERRIPMFPLVLAEGPFSLREGVPTDALSFSCRLDANGRLSDFEIVTSVIVPSKRLTYAQANNLIGEDDELLRSLATAARLREAWRQSQGAVAIRLPEMDVKVDLENDSVDIGVYGDNFARDMVAELMILAGEAAGRFFSEKNLPVLYRGQPASENTGGFDHLPEGPPREFAKVMTMNRSSFSVEGKPHAGLGLALYVQVTSPIRRYADLAVHYQLKAAVLGQPLPFTQEDWETLASELDPLSSQAAKLERNADRYWVTEFLSRQKGKIWKAQFLGWFREDDRQAQVLLEETGFRALMKLPQQKALGEHFKVKVAAADARKEVLTLTEVK